MRQMERERFMANKIITAKQAAAMVQMGDVVAINGFIMAGCPDELCCALEQHFLKEAFPRDLTLVCITSVGDGGTRGVNRLAHKGLVRRIISGHYNFIPKIQHMIFAEEIEAYNFPQGIMAQLLRDCACKNPLTVSPLGLDTFVDPRLQGGRLNRSTVQPLNEVMQIDGQEYLRYHSLKKVDCAFLRGTYADQNGNVCMRKEGATVDALIMAQAAKNSGGKVFVQVERVVERIHPHDVNIPSIMVDYIVPVSDMKYHMQSADTVYNPSYSGEGDVVPVDIPPVTNPERRIIVKRCLSELQKGSVINLGIGMPEGIAAMAAEYGITDFTLTVDVGIIGGTPAGGLDFGCTQNPTAIIYHSQLLDFFHGGGLHQAFLGLAECDRHGNVNVSKFESRITGIGGFIDLTQTAKKVYFIGTFTAKGLKTEYRNGALHIVREGSIKKFRRHIEQQTFSADRSRALAQQVMFVTERAVFSITEKGLTLTEIAPGINLERDILSQMEFRPAVSDRLKIMDQRYFEEQ